MAVWAVAGFKTKFESPAAKLRERCGRVTKYRTAIAYTAC
jgi:hypothetical protein